MNKLEPEFISHLKSHGYPPSYWTHDLDASYIYVTLQRPLGYGKWQAVEEDWENTVVVDEEHLISFISIAELAENLCGIEREYFYYSIRKGDIPPPTHQRKNGKRKYYTAEEANEIRSMFILPGF